MLAAKGIVYECLNITSCLGQTGLFFFLMNPLGKVPVIELPGGKVLYESAIVVSNRHEEWKCVGKISFKRSKLDL